MKKIISLLKSKDENKIYSGINAAYQVVISNKQEKLKFANEIHKILVEIIEKESLQNLGIVTRFYNKHLNNIPGAKETILKLLNKKNVEVQSEVSRSINAEFKFEEDPIYFQNCLNLLSFTEAEYKGIYSTINFRLKETFVSQPEVIVEFINHWIINNVGKLKKYQF